MAGGDGRVYVHRRVLFDAIGPGEHPCHWCGWQVSWGASTRKDAPAAERWSALLVDHLNGDIHCNDRSNLAAACHWCNRNRQALWLDNQRVPGEFAGVAPWDRPWLVKGGKLPHPDGYAAAEPAEPTYSKPRVGWDAVIDVAAWLRGEIVLRGAL